MFFLSQWEATRFCFSLEEIQIAQSIPTSSLVVLITTFILWLFKIIMQTSKFMIKSHVFREDWKPVLTINAIIIGLQYLFLVSGLIVRGLFLLH